MFKEGHLLGKARVRASGTLERVWPHLPRRRWRTKDAFSFVLSDVGDVRFSGVMRVKIAFGIEGCTRTCPTHERARHLLLDGGWRAEDAVGLLLGNVGGVHFSAVMRGKQPLGGEARVRTAETHERMSHLFPERDWSRNDAVGVVQVLLCPVVPVEVKCVWKAAVRACLT